MKASELKPGMEVGLWTVVSVFEVCGIVESRIQSDDPFCGGESVMRQADPWNTLIMVELERGIPDPGTWRTWYRADEDVEVMR